MTNTTDFITKIKGYKVSLLLSGSLLLILFSIIIYQILNLQQSGNLVSDQLDETRNINQLALNLNESKERFNNSTLTTKYLDSVIKENNQLIATLDIDYTGYAEFLITNNQLYN